MNILSAFILVTLLVSANCTSDASIQSLLKENMEGVSDQLFPRQFSWVTNLQTPGSVNLQVDGDANFAYYSFYDWPSANYGVYYDITNKVIYNYFKIGTKGSCSKSPASQGGVNVVDYLNDIWEHNTKLIDTHVNLDGYTVKVYEVTLGDENTVKVTFIDNKLTHVSLTNPLWNNLKEIDGFSRISRETLDFEKDFPQECKDIRQEQV